MGMDYLYQTKHLNYYPSFQSPSITKRAPHPLAAQELSHIFLMLIYLVFSKVNTYLSKLYILSHQIKI